MSIQYTLFPSNPKAHIYTITVYIEKPDPKGQYFSLPTWIPGSYMIREFSKNIVQMVGKVGENEVPIEQIDKHTWVVFSDGQPCYIEYEVYSWDLSVRMAHLDQTHGYCNGTSMFVRIHGFDEVVHRVLIKEPNDELCQGWRIATTLTALGSDPYEFGWFEAKDYDDLIDHPIEMGNFELLKFEANGIPHEIALTGRYRFCRERLVKDLKTICEFELNFFGNEPPMERYLFQIMVVGSGYGGLEHRSSTSLICSRDALPQDMESLTDEYIRFLGLCSHEYFHTWNIKRLKPAVFLPYDLSKEAYTTLLWVFEGWTSYYDDIILLRAGLINLNEYFNLIGRMISRVYMGSGLHKQSLNDSSFTAWTKFYRQDENSPNAVVSYYAKGAMAAMALDLYLRRETNNKTTLDDVMLKLWADYGSQNIGLPEDAVERLAGEISNVDLTGFFDQVVRGTGKIGLEGLLTDIGVVAQPRSPVSYSDLGGRPTKKNPIMHLGCTFSPGVNAKIRSVHDGGAAQRAGLSSGDILIAIDGIKVTKSNIENMIERYDLGEELNVHFFRRDELMQRTLILQESPFVVYYLELADADEETIERREKWLYGQ